MSSILSKLINLAGNITGLLPVANGGTGLASGTSGGVLAFTGSTTLASSAALTQHGVVIGGGAGATPTSTATGTNGQLLVGNTSADPTWGSTVSAATTFSGGVLFGGGTPANLNYYETGTFTPIFQSTGTIQVNTYTIQIGKYVRLGGIVWVTYAITASFNAGGSGSLLVGGLPYTVQNTANLFQILPAEIAGGAISGNNNYAIELQPNQTYGKIFNLSAAAQATPSSGTAQVWFTGWYTV